jgi:DNA-binding NtrC family response regulator
LFENELFGHGKGAFTDAREAQRGLIAQAEGGTLLLDEIDSLDPHSQAALLRFVQDKSYRQLGAGRDKTADVRIIVASNAVLEAHVADGRFRGDLLFRLDVARTELPPLRRRQVDILPLARHFLAKAAARYGLALPRIGRVLEQRLMDYNWPGNVRELENAMQRALLLADGADELPSNLRLGSTGFMFPGVSPESPESADFCGTLKTARALHNSHFEREYLTWLLRRSEGNITAASHAAGTERRHLGRMIHRHGIDPAAFRRRDGD